MMRPLQITCRDLVLIPEAIPARFRGRGNAAQD